MTQEEIELRLERVEASAEANRIETKKVQEGFLILWKRVNYLIESLKKSRSK